MPNEHVFDILPAYIMGCLDDDETQAVVNHLEKCLCCEMGYQVYKRVFADLPLRSAIIEPPPELREKILHRARQEGKLHI